MSATSLFLRRLEGIQAEDKEGIMERIFISDLFRKEELRGILEKTGCGVETIRFSVGDNLDDFSRQLREARRELQDLGQPALILHGPFLDLNPASYDSRIRQVTRERMEQAYRAAQLLGAEKIVFHSGRIPATVYLEGWADRITEYFEDFLRGKRGIQVLLENVFDPEYTGLLQAAEQIGHPDFGLCLDLGHAHCFSGYPAEEWAEKLGSHIRHVHVHDNDGSRDAHLALGRGSVPFAAAAAAVLKNSPGATWTVECASAEEAETSAAVLKNCISAGSMLE